ncbi:MAG: tRNA (adenosine(37)-N6)-threonylcarbamoyltransferase complex transferase subunit TsaD [Blastocatellia bacterium]|nr:tRNA (adenosine(37)-N6)-threonylcarbamoyltransferase complex transferase subunit TsaD [Blastocatellia bacterium]
MRLVLGIESSCDETAAAVIEDGCRIRSNLIASQIDIHRPFGGVVPELASRQHLASIGEVVSQALRKAEIELNDIDAIAVTYGPGLVGALLVGVCYAKSIAYALKKPIIGVNHLEGHIYSVVFDNPPINYPALAMVVSGGHTSIYLVLEPEHYKLIGHTRDDAAGEAFDKVAKLLGLGYPGGPVIDRLAKTGNADAAKLTFTIPHIAEAPYDFSFSGLKTAVLRYVKEKNLQPLEPGQEPTEAIRDLSASFQQAVVRTLTSKLVKAAKAFHPKTLILAGGVACNSLLRATLEQEAEKLQIPLHYPSPILTTDNGAMIAAAGYPKLLRGERAKLDLTATASLKLHNVDIQELQKGKPRYRLS